MPAPHANSSAPGGGIFHSARSLMATWVAILRTRVEIISTELEEQREWLEQLVIYGVASLFLLSFGLLLLTLFVVMCFWESHRLLVLGIFSGLYLLGGFGAVLAFRSKVRNKPKLFAATADELAKDHAYLQPENP
ncbi:MAG: phage holin family protein [Verrucomicrobiales bacterium]